MIEPSPSPARRRARALSLLPALLLIAACGDDRRDAAQPAPPTPTVTVAMAEMRPVTPGRSFVGRIEAVEEVQIRARVQGFLEQREFEEGQPVKAGQVLYRIERAPFEAEVAQREADLAAARAEAENAKVQLKRALELAAEQNIPQATVDERRAAAATAEARVKQAEAALRAAEINLGYTVITAPIDGKIGRSAYTPGNLVGPDSGVLATIVSQDPMYVSFPVSAREVLAFQRQAVEDGAQASDFVVRLRLPDGSEYPHPGRIDFLGVQVDPSTDTVTVRAVVPNPDGLLVDNQFVNVRVEREQPVEALVVPQVALQIDQTGTFVLVVNDDNQVERRAVTVGQTLEGWTVIRDGLQEGERVITMGIQAVQPGQTVEVTTAPSPEA